MTEARLRQGEFPTVSDIVKESSGILDELLRGEDNYAGGDEAISDVESSKDDEEADPTYSPDEGDDQRDDSTQRSFDSSSSQSDTRDDGLNSDSSVGSGSGSSSQDSPVIIGYDTDSYDARVASRVFTNMGGAKGGCGIWLDPGILPILSSGKSKRGAGGSSDGSSVGKVASVCKKKKKQGEGSFVHRDLGLI